MTLAAVDTQHELDTFVFTVLILLFIAAVLITCAIGLAKFVSHSDVHVSGSVDHRVSGRVEHEHSGTVRQIVEHSGTVQHVHQLDEADRARLDRMNAQRELEAAERARLERLELSRQLDAIERRQRPRMIIDAEVVRPAIERGP